MKIDDRFEDLMSRHIEGTATREESRELEAAILLDDSRRRLFLRYLRIDAALIAFASGGVVRVDAKWNPTCARRRGGRAACLTAAAASIVLAFLLLWWRNTAPHHDGAAPFALLAAGNGAVWADPNAELALRAGELPAGLMDLDSGTAEFVCLDGATVAFRGPASFRFLDRKQVYVKTGRVQCHCPTEKSRLTVLTPSTEIRDLGTEFAVEVRSDETTRVAVLSGEVQIGASQPRRLRKGEAAELRGDGQLAIEPYTREDFAALQLASPSVRHAVSHSLNLLRDPGFEKAPDGQIWMGTGTNLASASTALHGRGIRVFARGSAPWPLCRQMLKGEPLAGRLVIASVWACVVRDDPLEGRQTAVLKIAFKDEEGRDFAFACQRFLSPRSEPGRFEQAQIAAIAPAETAKVDFQVMLQSDLRERGSVIFDDGSLLVTDAPAEN